MATSAQIRANRINALRSTGPATAEGKSASSRNGITHGLTSKAVVLPHEDAAEYEQLRVRLMDEMKPYDIRETLAVEAMAQTWWRLQRAQSAESGFFSLRVKALAEKHPDLSKDSIMSMIFVEPAESAGLARIQRYLRAAERAYERAKADFREAREDNLMALKGKMLLENLRAKQALAAKNEDDDDLSPEEFESLESEIGFASHNALSLPFATEMIPPFNLPERAA